MGGGDNSGNNDRTFEPPDDVTPNLDPPKDGLPLGERTPEEPEEPPEPDDPYPGVPI